jgi:uncharacterized SAM-binding protein YcdF (DUF218 family)
VFLCAALLYVLSITPTRDMVLGPLEKGYPVATLEDIRQTDGYVLLGGGIVDGIPGPKEGCTPSLEAFPRITELVRLHHIVPKPCILSGGSIFGRPPEADVLKATLISMGMPPQQMIPENRSRDTFENARYTAEIAEARKIHRIALVTSAFHMKRSVMLFSKHFQVIVPCPAGFKAGSAHYNVLSFLPDASNMYEVALAFKEYLGILFYRITL